MTTEFPSGNGIPRKWRVIDAQGVVLGKLASRAAMVLMGKTKTSYTPFLDCGDPVIVINADKVLLTGGKEEKKVYRHFTGYPGGLVEKPLRRVRSERPIRIVEDAIFGMLPKSKLGKQMYRKLKVYAGDRHPHAAQKPVALAITSGKGN
ncbi:MAG: 50S ribosomal protein L13 [Bryobacteraceae bacterium]|jgi:large subunit ribosomal protein L13